MMDIDTNPNLSISNDYEEATAFSCASCLKRVCDICAVRSDRRVCLECANPGNGNRYGSAQGHEVVYGYSNGAKMDGGGTCGMEAGNMYGYGGVGVEGKRWVGGIGWL